MDLALLVYGISLLAKLSAFFVGTLTIACGLFVVFGAWYLTETDRKSYYSDQMNDKREANGVMCVRRMKQCIAYGVFACLMLVAIPSEKTAFTMVGAYAAQKVAENDKVQAMSGKVLTIIEQKLDHYIDEGIQEAQDKVEKKSKRKEK